VSAARKARESRRGDDNGALRNERQYRIWVGKNRQFAACCTLRFNGWKSRQVRPHILINAIDIF
jgi:hypothetical protein